MDTLGLGAGPAPFERVKRELIRRSEQDALLLRGKSGRRVTGDQGERVNDVALMKDFCSPLTIFTLSEIRKRPRQARALHSVDRIQAAAVEIALRTAPSRVRLETISTVAGVTTQTAYRYFRDADSAISTGLRCLVVREHERMIAVLSDHLLSDWPALTYAVIKLVLDGRDVLRRLSAPIHGRTLDLHREIGIEASPVIAKLICCGAKSGDIRRSIDVDRFAQALIAVYAVSGSSELESTFQPRRAAEDLLATLFVGLLQDQG